MLWRQRVPIALAVVLALTTLLIWRFEWWPAIPIGVLTVIVLIATRWRLEQGRVRWAVLGVGAALVIGLAGFWFGLLGISRGARPCDNCADNSALPWPGLGLLVVGVALFLVSLRSLISVARRPPVRPDSASLVASS